jgi:hypothetical protein
VTDKGLIIPDEELSIRSFLPKLFSRLHKNRN